MKLSTRIKKYVPEYSNGPIKMMVDCGKKETRTANTLEEADRIHEEYTGKGYTLLPQECPVVNQHGVVMHYASGSYAEWCNI